MKFYCNLSRRMTDRQHLSIYKLLMQSPESLKTWVKFAGQGEDLAKLFHNLLQDRLGRPGSGLRQCANGLIRQV